MCTNDNQSLFNCSVYFCFVFLQEIMLQQVMSKIAVVKKDMIILEKSEFSTLLTENEVKSDHRAFLTYLCAQTSWFTT